ncbi:MAG: hypothetical protein ABI443_02935 [Chthoniobacterales bacterium]
MEAVLPDLQAVILCEDVRAELNGQHSIIGVIEVIPAPALPIGFFKLCLWTRWCGGMGSFNQRSVIQSSDDEGPIAEVSISFQLKEMDSQATNVHFFGGLQFQKYGTYHVEIYLEEELRMRFPLSVVRVPMPPSGIGS